MKYAWLPRYIKKRAYQQWYFLRAPNHYDLSVAGLSLRLHFSTAYHHSVAHAMAFGGWDELALLPDWIRYAEGARVIFDVGGFNGIYGLLAKKANPKADVYIFEPDPVNAWHIRENARLNKLDIKLVTKAATDHDGTINFSGDGSSGSRVTAWGEPVAATLLSKYGAPDLMKLDIEGHEPEALRGADLSRMKYLFVEMNHSLSLPAREIKRVNLNAVFQFL